MENRHYFYLKDGQQIGPIPFEDLKKHNIRKDTLIWYDGITDWTQAQNVDELQILFATTPPPIPKNVQQTTANVSKNEVPQKKKSKSIIVFLFIVIGLMIVGIAITEFNAIDSIANMFASPKTEAQLRQELLNKERATPLLYLDDKNVKMEEKFLSIKRKAEITGTITNNATLAKYKDVKVRVDFYSRTNSVIESQRFVFYNYYPPQSSMPFSLEVIYPKAYTSFGFVIEGASPVYE